MKGGYCLVMSLISEASVKSNRKEFLLSPGTYAYCGSALNSLDARVSRHILNFKTGSVKRFWHIDHLLPLSERLSIVKAASATNIECQLVSHLVGQGLQAVAGFGSSDCRSGCIGHLLRSEVSFPKTTEEAVSSFKRLGLAPTVLEASRG